MENPCAEPNVTPTQKRLLQIVFEHFRSTGKWPKARIIQIEFASYGDSWAESEEISHHLLRNRGSKNPPESEIVLSIEGIAECNNSEYLIALFLRSLEICVNLYKTNPLEPIITRNAIKTALSLNDIEASTALELLFVADRVWDGASLSQDHILAELKLSPDILRYIAVTRIDQYLSIVREKRTPENYGVYPSGIAEQTNRVDRILSRIKNIRIVAPCVILGIIVIAIGTFTDAIDKIYSFVGNVHYSKIAENSSRESLSITIRVTNQGDKDIVIYSYVKYFLTEEQGVIVQEYKGGRLKLQPLSDSTSADTYKIIPNQTRIFSATLTPYLVNSELLARGAGNMHIQLEVVDSKEIHLESIPFIRDAMRKGYVQFEIPETK